ncbi:MAG: hypothetical protein KJ709_03610 [Nanoarchaeota archaeon]|nr:hypothetical protein [Nanoarchaeota archaeon]
MDDTEIYLRDWFVHYIKHKDLVLRRIQAIDNTDQGLKLTMKDRVVDVLVEIQLTHAIHRLKDGWLYIVTLHNEENTKALAANWKSFSSNPKLTIFFVNPFSSQETKWVIMPYTHERICDISSLEQGFVSLAELVDPITVEELKRKMR